jgi:negative regulator of flagellin synthesis FlgM
MCCKELKMTGIADLSAVFGSPTRISEADGDALSLGRTVSSSNKSAISNTDQSLLNSDKSVVSSAGDAMLQAMGQPDVRTDKVASLQTAIANGTYNVSSSDVAQKLISSMLDKG